MTEEQAKRENCFAIFGMIVSLIAIGVTLWLLNQPSCWQRYDTETQAIQQCEQ